MSRKTLSDALALGAVPPAMAAYVRLVERTTRWSRLNGERFEALNASGSPYICAFWHSRLLMLPLIVPEMGRTGTAMVSAHRDGELIARTLGRLGVASVRGSAADPRKPGKAKGGSSALRALVSLARAGGNTAVTPDGPRGPRQVAQPGVAQLARLTSLPVLPIAWATQRGRTLGTWDAFVLPYPFGRGVFAFGEPLRVDGRGTAAIEAGRQRIEAALNAVTAEADQAMGRVPAGAVRASLPA